MSLDDLALPFGAYETPVTARIRERIEATREAWPSVGISDPVVDSHLRQRYIEAVSRNLADRLTRKLEAVGDSEQRIDLINGIARLLDEGDTVLEERLLHAVYESKLADPPHPPEISLAGASLMTNAPKEPSLSNELRREIATADSVDLLIAFIKRSGIAVLDDHLTELRDRGIPFRVITSTYCGATESAAVERLVTEYGAQVKIGYESRNTRLHAKPGSTDVILG